MLYRSALSQTNANLDESWSRFLTQNLMRKYSRSDSLSNLSKPKVVRCGFSVKWDIELIYIALEQCLTCACRNNTQDIGYNVFTNSGWSYIDFKMLICVNLVFVVNNFKCHILLSLNIYIYFFLKKSIVILCLF